MILIGIIIYLFTFRIYISIYLSFALIINSCTLRLTCCITCKIWHISNNCETLTHYRFCVILPIGVCCCFNLISCGIAVWNYRYKQAKMAEKTIVDCTGSVYWCEQQLTAAGASGC